MMDVMSICIVLHNLYIITNNIFDTIWIQKTSVKLIKLVENNTVKIIQIYEANKLLLK